MNKTEIISGNNFKNRTFGQLVFNFRKTLNLTQEDFGKLIMISRVTTLNIEKLEDVKELSDDLLFRLNHLSYRLMTNENFDDLVKFSAEKVYNITYVSICERINNNIDNQALKIFIKN